MKVGGVMGIGCHRLGRSVSCERWLKVWMNGRGICWFGEGDWPQKCTICVLMWSSNRLVILARSSFTSRMSCPNSSWIFSIALIWASNRSTILIPRKQIWEKVFKRLMSWCVYDACMHNTKSMKLHVVHKKVRPIIIYYQSMHDKTLKKSERNENTYLIPIYFLQIFLSIHTISIILYSTFFFIYQNSFFHIFQHFKKIYFF